jgi:hypothetical protein
VPRVKIPVPVPQPVVQAAAPAVQAVPPAPVMPVAPPVVTLAPAAVSAPMSPNLPPKQPLLNRQRVVGGLVAAGFAVVVVLLVGVLQDRNKLQTQVSKLSGAPAVSGAQQLGELTKQIGASFQLPAGETPTLATVSDASKVRSQAFFKDTQNGDKVLLYSKAGEAILYRPSTKKIISVAPVNLNGTGSGASSSTTTP